MSSAVVSDPERTALRGKLLQGLGRCSAAPDARTVLGRVNVNVNPNGSTSSLHKRTTTRPPPSLSAKMIPRPAATPDVFAPEESKPRSTTTTNNLGKRARDNGTGTPQAVPTKRARADATALAAKSHQEEQNKWLAKWAKAFPSLVFHFEIGVDEGPGRGLRTRVLNMGARVDQFFSQRVSHLVVKGNTSPQKPKSVGLRRGNGQSDNPFLDSTGVTDLVQKAEKLGVKVWTVKKLADMLEKLAPLDTTEGGDSLSHLLADEKIHGTRERDLTAPRPDYYYFKPGSKYLLVEDATGRSRPVMIKEYSTKERDWPTLHEQFLRPSSSAQLPSSVRESSVAKDVRARAWALFVDNVPFRGEVPPVPSLKRSNSLREMPITPLPEELPYAKASGNSVVITSNIASTSNANNTPGTFVGGVPQLGANKDRAIMQMSKRVQVLKGNARLAAGAKKPETKDGHIVSPELNRRRSTGMDAPAPAAVKEFLTQSQVVAMLHQLRAPTNMTKPTYDERVRNREHVDAGYKRKEQDTASGYCENCRIRYTDLSVHIASKKHRRFAANPKHFADLDDMLQCLQRPPNPAICIPSKVCRPCHRAHGKDDECGRCMDDPDLYSSPPPSEPGSVRRHNTHSDFELDGEDEEEDELAGDDGMEGRTEDDDEGVEGEGEVMHDVDEAAEAADQGEGSEA